MFLRCRSTQAEYFDAPDRSFDTVREGYALLGRVNRFVRFAEPFERVLPQALGASACECVRVLDLGAGDGSLGRSLTGWAAQRGWFWQVTNLDLNPLALKLAKGGHNVGGSALRLPFKDGSFDVVIGTQMTHHLDSDADVVTHFREAWRVSRRLVMIYDLHRNPGLYCALAGVLLAMRVPAHFRSDGLVSVKRGWRVPEWQRFAEAAGISGGKVWLDYGTRIVLLAEKATAAGHAKPILKQHRRAA